MSIRGLAAAMALASAVAAAGCGLGAGPSSVGTVTLTVTRDYGSVPVVEKSEDDPSASETVLRMLDRNASITTRYGGGFVQSIEGVEGSEDAGRNSDWFFYVNGVESPTGAADVNVGGGDRIWWDYRDWTDAVRVPAVVGSYPQPFASANGTVPVDCRGAQAACDAVASTLRDSGVDAKVSDGLGESGLTPRVLVGTWGQIKSDDAAAQLNDGPAVSGVFARFDGDSTLATLGVRAEPVQELGAGAGLLAAVRLGDDAPTWLVTGTDPAGVASAAALFAPERLHDRYALAAEASTAVSLPVEAHVDLG